jgi:hypothetical protein
MYIKAECESIIYYQKEFHYKINILFGKVGEFLRTITINPDESKKY